MNGAIAKLKMKLRSSGLWLRVPLLATKPLKRSKSKWQAKRNKMLLLLASFLSFTLLPGCASLSQTRLTATQSKVICEPWRAIKYSGNKDTPLTVEQVRVHNQTGRNLHCW